MNKFMTWIVVLVLMAGSASADNLETILTDKLIDDYGLERELVSVSLVRSAVKLNNLSDCEVRAYPMTQSDPRGRFPMRVEIFRDGAMIDKGAVSLDVRLSADLLVPIRNIKRHEKLHPEMFTVKRFDITTRTERMLAEVEHMTGCRAKQNLTAGRYVPLSRLEKIPDIENGAQIAIIGGSSLLEIRVKGVALQNGNIGESIRVKNVDSRKILVGRVIGPGTVEIAL